MDKDQKVLREIKEQNQKILEHLAGQGQESKAQFGSIHEDLGVIKSELSSVKMAVMDNSLQIKELKVETKEVKQTINSAVTNHESRIRRLEEKVGV